MSLPWLKLYISDLSDPRIMQRCTPAERWIWIALNLCAQQCDRDGELALAEQSPLTLDELARTANVPLPAMRQALAKFEALGMITRQGDLIILPEFAYNQHLPPSARPPATRERKRHERARKRADVTTLSQPPVTTRGEERRRDISTTDLKLTLISALALLHPNAAAWLGPCQVTAQGQRLTITAPSHTYPMLQHRLHRTLAEATQAAMGEGWTLELQEDHSNG